MDNSVSFFYYHDILLYHYYITNTNIAFLFSIFLKKSRENILHYFRHLENNPSKYGVHASSFLSGETWEAYLQRMKQSGEWGDHIILQALADVFLLHICVYSLTNKDIRRTDITTEQILPVTSRFCIALGHVRETHYCSLRPTQWLAELPYSNLFSFVF